MITVLPDVHFGTAATQNPAAWREVEASDQDDDAELAATPADVIAMLGFDPLDLDREGVAQDAIAFDKKSLRRYDQDGRLHLDSSNISKANVCPYLGAEINAPEGVTLDPKKTYYLLRDPEELKKGASTFNNIPILDEHVPVHASAPQKQIVIGSTGTDATFKGPYLTNSLVFWDQDAIDDIESEERVELSCAYHYVADMTPGVYNGTPYDGVMREIRGNHVALVPEGRAGSDVVVGDSQLKLGETGMATQSTLSRKAMLAKGALLVALPSMLAADAKPTFAKDLQAALTGVASDNWKTTGKAKIIAAFKGKLARDATPAKLANLLDSLDTEDPQDGNPNMDGGSGADDPQVKVEQVAPKAALQEGMGEAEDAPVAKTVDKDTDPNEGIGRASVKPTQPAEDDEGGEPDFSALSPEHMAIVKAVLAAVGAGSAKDAPPPELNSKTSLVDQPKGAAMRQGMGKEAMDAAIKKAVEAASVAVATKVKADMRAVAEAEEAVRPYVGKLAVACDSADGVYKAALDALGVNVEGVHPSAFRHLLAAQRRPDASAGQRPALRLAADSSSENFDTMFPEASRIRHA